MGTEPMATSSEGPAVEELERRVMEAVKVAEARGMASLACALEVGRCVQEIGLGIPSLELGEVLVSNLCYAPSLWKLLHHSISSRLVSPIHVLSLLTPRVIPHRRGQPEAYRLYLELLGRYTFSFSSMNFVPYHDRIIKSVDESLQLSSTYGIQALDIGTTTVLFLFCIVMNLLNSVLEDTSLCFDATDKKFPLSMVTSSGMEIDVQQNSNEIRNDRRHHLRRTNAFMAVDVLEKITATKKSKVLLRLVHLNMPDKFNCLLQRLHIVEAQKMVLQNFPSESNLLGKICANIRSSINRESLPKHCQFIESLINIGSCQLSGYHCSGAGPSACWVPLDVIMETSMDGRQLYATSTVVMLTELTLNLQVLNQASWQETFEALFVSALRLVQRDREPVKGPVPGIDARLCVLLSITPLAVAAIIKEEVETLNSAGEMSRNLMANNRTGLDGNIPSSRRHGLVSCLQQLGRFTSLLYPPPSVVTAANIAASKAASFLSNIKKGHDSYDGINSSEISSKAVGSMLHLIIESCIARKLIDTSAYLWPGYVVTTPLSSMESMPAQESPWLTFMGGAPLSGPLKNSLMTIPATSVAQVEKVYHIALNGSDEERCAAAKILCGASLRQGWNVQESVVRLVVKLLSPPPPPDFSGPGSHIFSYLPMINSVLYGASCIDVVHMISLFGLVPEVAAALVPLCEAFGSVTPKVISKGLANDESLYSVFSFAFLFLLRLWKFYRPPHEHNLAGRWGNVRPELTLDYILLMRKGSVASRSVSVLDGGSQATAIPGGLSEPVYISSFPKLRAWYIQNQACIAAPLPGVCSLNSVHQVANKILSMIYRKMSKGGPVQTSNSSISGSSMSTGEDAFQKPLIPAWDVLEAIPFVLEAILNACANGRLSSRELTIGLRDLVDFLPASLAIIISYFSAEITRGIWKPVQMDGIDWPSPAANLVSIESEIKDILASAGVHVPSCYAGGNMPVMLPLPMAALLSLTITFKLDNTLEYIHAVAGPALENCATGCSWSSMPIVGALWAQKVVLWHDFIVVSSARCPFTQDRNAVSQLLRSCFSSFLGPLVISNLQLSTCRGVNGFIGCALSDKGTRLPVAPGFLYLRSCRNFIDTRFLNSEVLKLTVESAGELASGWTSGAPVRLKSTQASLTSAATRAKEIAMLGSSLICIAGGVRLVQVLYMETLPTWLLTKNESKSTPEAPASLMLKGYTLAYMMVLSGAFLWGVGDGATGYILSVRPRRDRTISYHMDFIAGVMEGNISLGCHPVTWKAYVSCFLGLVVRFAPAWVPKVNVQTLRKVANGLRGWHEYGLALTLLEHGGPEAITSVVESIL